jgi:molybdopterin converting factor small subunit
MRVTIKLFGQERQTLGEEAALVEIGEEPITCGALRERLAQTCPPIAERLPWCRFAINYEFATDDTMVSAQDEVALIGAVSGG